MKLFLKLFLSVATVCALSAPAAGNPTKNQTPEVDWKKMNNQSWPLHTTALLTSPITRTHPHQVTTFSQEDQVRSRQISGKLTKIDGSHPTKLIYSPQQNSLFEFPSQLQWPGLQQQPGFQPQTTQFFYQQPQFPNTPQFPNIPPQFLFQNPNFVYPYSPFTPSFPIPPAAIPPTTTPTTTTTTERPSKKKEREPTTAKPFFKRINSQPSLIKQQTQIDPSDFRNDAPLLAGVRKINPYFVIEEILPVPGTHVFSNNNISEMPKVPTAPKQNSVKTLSGDVAKLGKKNSSVKPNEESGVKVEAKGMTATSGNIPEIPFGTYFLPYLSQQRLGSAGGKVASLILEPHSKAVVGNGGTAVSRPISRAFLKKGVPTNVYFNPESVAIAGVGGKAHAQADLELDLISRRR